MPANRQPWEIALHIGVGCGVVFMFFDNCRLRQENEYLRDYLPSPSIPVPAPVPPAAPAVPSSTKPSATG